jgi:urease accessory protein
VEQQTQLIPSAVQGRLHLEFVYDQPRQQTRLAVSKQQAPLQVIRAFPLDDGGSLVHLHNLSGGVLGGDQLTLSVEVGAGAYAQLTSTSATRVYRSRPEMCPAFQENTILLREGALLEYLPDPLIPFAGARYRQRTQITLEHDAGLFWWEVITPGRVARNEVFDYDMLQMELAIIAQRRPVAIESFKLEPHHRVLTSPARLGAYRYTCSFYICRVGLAATRWSGLEQELSQLACQLTRPGEISWGVSTLVAHGLVIRAVSKQGREIAPGLQAFWHTAKLALYGQPAIAPRKIY